MRRRVNRSILTRALPLAAAMLSLTLLVSSAAQETEQDELEDVYRGCFMDKGCLGLPTGCVDAAKCKVLLTYAGSGAASSLLNVTLYSIGMTSGGDRAQGGGGGSYAAFSLSTDSSMGDELVFACVSPFDSSPPQMALYWNLPSKQNKPLDLQVSSTLMREIMSEVRTARTDGDVASCSFTLQYDFLVPEGEHNGQTVYQMSTESYHLLLASGGVKSAASAGENPHLSYHMHNRLATASPLRLDNSSIAKTATRSATLIQLHAVLMLFAWIWLASSATMLPRYYKSVYGVLVRPRICLGPADKALWFVAHTKTIFLVAVLSTISAICVFASQGVLPYSAAFVADNPHPVIGMLCLVLLAVQAGIALVRPASDAPMRPLFNWFHRVVGIATHSLAVISAYLGISLVALGSGVQDGAIHVYTVLLLTYVAVHLSTHIYLTIHQMLCREPADSAADADLQKKEREIKEDGSGKGDVDDGQTSRWKRRLLSRNATLTAVNVAYNLFVFLVAVLLTLIALNLVG